MCDAFKAGMPIIIERNHMLAMIEKVIFVACLPCE